MLKINDLSYSYNSEKVILNNITLDIKKGEFVGLIGPNGSGKTTLIKIICDLLELAEGSILIKNNKHTDKEIKRDILYLPSEDILPEFLSGEEYIYLMHKLYKKKVDIIYLDVLLEEYHFKQNSKNLIEEYSMGMKKKIQFINAMLLNPSILIVDETMNGMDVESRDITKKLLLNYSNGDKIIIMCSHDLDLLEKMCDKLVIISKGSVEYHGEMIKDLEEKFRDFISKGILNYEKN